VNATRPLHLVVTQFFKFACVGVCGTAAAYSALIALVEVFKVPVIAATTVGFVVGAIVNYILNRRFTFVSEANHAVALPKFLTVAAFGAAINAFMVGWLVEHGGVHYLIAQICATATVLVWNFVANTLWTFKR
jgi:putative flippase GtrA